MYKGRDNKTEKDTWALFWPVFRGLRARFSRLPEPDLEDALASAIMDWWQRFCTLEHRGMLRWVARRALWRLLNAASRQRPTNVAIEELFVECSSDFWFVERLKQFLGEGEALWTLWRWACGYTAHEIGQQDGVSPSTVRKRIARLLQRLSLYFLNPATLECHTLGGSGVINNGCGNKGGLEHEIKGKERKGAPFVPDGAWQASLASPQWWF